MTKSYYPFASGPGRVINAQQWSEMAKNWVRDGVVRDLLNALEVYADSSGMQVKVKSGIAYVQGQFFKSDALEVLSIAAADPTNPRIDRVVVRVDWVNSLIDLAVLTGTPAASPSPPALTQNSNTWEMSLAQVYVTAGAITIAAVNVTDERGWPTINPLGYEDMVNRPLAPAAPGSGVTRLYVKTDGLLYRKNSAGVESVVGELWQHAQSNTTPDGSTTQFNIGSGVASSKVAVYVNGLLRRPETDYTFVAGNSYVTFAWAPATGDDVRMDYVAV